MTDKEARFIAEELIKKREKWPKDYRDKNGLIHSSICGVRRINNGSWRAIAHRGMYSDAKNSCGDFVFDVNKAVIIEISEDGKIVRYFKAYTSAL